VAHGQNEGFCDAAVDERRAAKSPAVAAFQVQLKLLKFRAYLATTIDRKLSPSTNLSTRILV